MEQQTHGPNPIFTPLRGRGPVTWLVGGAVAGLLVGFLLGRATAGPESAPSPPDQPTATVTAAAAPADSPTPGDTPAAPTAPPPPLPPAPPSLLSLRLLGTVMDSPTQGVALIENPATGKQSFYEVGDLVAPGVTIERISAERIILLRNGKREALRLTKAK